MVQERAAAVVVRARKAAEASASRCSMLNQIESSTTIGKSAVATQGVQCARGDSGGSRAKAAAGAWGGSRVAPPAVNLILVAINPGYKHCTRRSSTQRRGVSDGGLARRAGREGSPPCRCCRIDAY